MRPLPPGHEAISASAGSGKTFQLAHRYIRLLAAGVEPDRIAALTFSRKAAGEIFDSIVGYLCDAAGSRQAAATTSRRLGVPELPPDDYVAMLRRLLNMLNRLHIGTLDSFTVGVLRSFPFELGIPPAISLMGSGSAEALEVQQQALSSLFHVSSAGEGTAAGLLDAFTRASFGRSEKKIEARFVEFINGYHSLLRLMPEASSWGEPDIIWPEGSPWPAAGDPAEACATLERELASREARDKVMERFRAFGRAAQTYSARSAWSEPLRYLFPRLLDAADDLRRGSATVMTDRINTVLDGAAAQAALALVAHIVRTELDISLSRTRGIHSLVDRYNVVYEQMIRAAGALTFEDAQFLLSSGNRSTSGARLSREREAEDRIFIDYRLDARLDHWLLDEFQDTSDLQWNILSNLAEETLQDCSGERSFFFVGDVKQAIYGWRGGNPRLFGMLLDRYGEVISTRELVESRRSCPAVIDMVNAVFGDLPQDALPGPAIARWRRFWQQHRSAEDGPARMSGAAALIEPPCDGGDYKPVKEDRYRIVAGLLNEIRPLERGLSAAVLVRSNADGRAVVDYLRAACPGLPVVHEGRAAIVDNPVVSVLLSLVRFAAHPGDTFAWRHVQMSPLRQVLEERRLTRESLSLSLLNTIQADGFRGLLDDWGGALDAACELDAFGRERLRHLMSAAGEFDTGGSRDCSAFLSFIDTYELHETAADDSIRVMTMHQAKGLGFDIVLLPELDDTEMSTARSVPMLTGYDANAEPAWVLATPGHGVAEADPVLKTALAEANAASAFESLCLLYVAMTRAKRGLYIVTAYPGKTARTFDQAALLKQMLVGDTKPTQGETTRVDSADVTVLKSYGDTTWYHSLPLRPASTAPVEPSLPTRPPRERIPVRPHLTAVRPSDHDLFEPRAWALFTPERSHRVETGTAVHELLSRVTWLDEVDVSAIEERWLAAAERDPEIARDALQHFRHAIGLQALRPVFQRPSPHAEVRTEWRFDTVAEERWITGSFDRVVVERNEDGRVAGASIYDFKTDDVGDGGAVNTRAGHYAPQMRAYRDALAQLLGIPPQCISLTLVFTGAGVVRRIT